MQPSVPLSMLLTKDVVYEWHDGVALTAQLVAQVRIDDPRPQLPDLRGVTLEENGSLTLSAHPDHVVAAMPGAARVLQELLSGKDQPTQLRLFAMQAASAEPPMTLGHFAEELAKWERPNRTAKLAALHQRAVAHIGPDALTDEAKLREAAAAVAVRGPVTSGAPSPSPAAGSAKPSAPKPLAQAPDSTSGLSIVLLVAGAMVFAAGATWFVLSRGTTAQPQPSAVAPEGVPDDAASAEPGDGASSAARRSGGRRAGAATGQRAIIASAEAELARGRQLFANQDYAAAAAAFERVMQIVGREPGPRLEELRHLARSLADVAHAAVVEQVEAATREYRAGDEGIIEPVPLGFLPPKPDPETPPDRLQVMEVHINASGTVDTAKFVMNRPSFRNSWWTSAAKAWRFSPATRNGRPVRFVMRIVMDDSAAR